MSQRATDARTRNPCSPPAPLPPPLARSTGATSPQRSRRRRARRRRPHVRPLRAGRSAVVETLTTRNLRITRSGDASTSPPATCTTPTAHPPPDPAPNLWRRPTPHPPDPLRSASAQPPPQPHRTAPPGSPKPPQTSPDHTKSPQPDPNRISTNLNRTPTQQRTRPGLQFPHSRQPSLSSTTTTTIATPSAHHGPDPRPGVSIRPRSSIPRSQRRTQDITHDRDLPDQDHRGVPP